MASKIDEFIEENREMYIKWLTEFCKIPSVAAQNRGMEDAVSYLDDLFQKAFSLTPEKLPTAGFPVVYAELEGRSDKILSFYNHYDVQPEDPMELWNSPPFEPEIREGKIFARGVADNKGNLVARIAAIHAIKQLGMELPVDIKFIFEGEEEIGSLNLPAFAKNYAEKIHADGCVWEFGYRDADGALQVSLGVKGMLYVELSVEGANTDLHSAQGAIIESPVWKLVWALSTLKDREEKITIPGFYDDIEPITQLDEEMLANYRLDEGETLRKLDLDSFLLNLEGEQLKRKHIFEPTCNICGIVSGYIGEGTKTVLPSSAAAKLDFRLVPGQDPEKILMQLREHLNNQGFKDIKIKVTSSERAARTKPDQEIVKAMIEVAEQYSDKKPNIVPNTPGTGPMYELCQALGIPSASFGVGNFQSNNHAPNENIFVEDYIEGIKMIAALVFEFSRQFEKQGSVNR
ncbi:acetylornithine deacetylase/succinyl-diaminopimelate desuccinylase-like protein [Planomicrobium stackebrandtii]|uniref:Acetylornithine deacetylase/succinyl-diaminopimelate desuccinylase-like protein n=1 Tax=Planomicrobium stackebrandtii TaxID=253160 RepID=A0ABU0GRY5_9BACL|nr:M20/M25/M40 family metallo-hydrolase [Planomicrobium stackebrandtii]MDQ0428117.1 acetylornithine deacetylase/succinyl-diaminopimelate desuccinylase-like protein [Planomicrobium stackebrandtii]